MQTLTTLSARSLQYYIIAKRWSADLDFFRIEKDFFKELLKQLAPESDVNENFVHEGLNVKLQNLNQELMEGGAAVAEYLNKLELIADQKFPEIRASLIPEHACLEYRMLDLVDEFRQLKLELFKAVKKSCLILEKSFEFKPK